MVVFNLRMTFDVLDTNQNRINSTSTVKRVVIRVAESKKTVTLNIPQLVLNMASTGGYFVTVAGHIPLRYRPNNQLYIPFSLSANGQQSGPVILTLFVANDGTLRISDEDGLSLPPDVYTTTQITISYQLPTFTKKPPANYKLSLGPSQATSPNFISPFNQFLEYYINSFVDGKFITCWSDNYRTQSPYPFNIMTRGGTVTGNMIKIGNLVKAINSPQDNYMAENSISINPTNTNNIVFTTILIDFGAETQSDVIQLIRGVSNDGGKTWPIIGRVDTLTDIPNMRSDPSCLFDRFGNCWIILMTYDVVSELPVQMNISVSIDGGVTFNTVVQTTDDSPAFVDYPHIAFGGDGNGGWALYFVVDLYSGDNFITPVVGGIQVFGLGDFGDFSFTYLLDPDTFIPFGVHSTITASDNGNVYVRMGDLFYSGNSFEKVVLAFSPDGFDSFGIFPSTFVVTDVAKTNIGYQTGNLRCQNIRGVLNIAPNSMAYDNGRGLLYTVIFDAQPLFSQNCTIYLLISNDNGETWYQPYTITTTNVRNKMAPSIAYDSTSDTIFISWYDSRNDSTNKSVQYYSAFVKGSMIDELVNLNNQSVNTNNLNINKSKLTKKSNNKQKSNAKITKSINIQKQNVNLSSMIQSIIEKRSNSKNKLSTKSLDNPMTKPLTKPIPKPIPKPVVTPDIK